MACGKENPEGVVMKITPTPWDLIKELPVFAWQNFKFAMDQWLFCVSNLSFLNIY